MGEVEKPPGKETQKPEIDPNCACIDELEERRANRNLKHFIIRYSFIFTGVIIFTIVLSSIYGWLILGKDFLSTEIGGLMEHFFKILQFVFTM